MTYAAMTIGMTPMTIEIVTRRSPVASLVTITPHEIQARAPCFREPLIVDTCGH